MKKLFTFAFIFAISAACPIIADTATSTDEELNSLIAELNDSDVESAANEQEQDSSDDASAPAEDASTSSPAPSAE